MLNLFQNDKSFNFFLFFLLNIIYFARVMKGGNR